MIQSLSEYSLIYAQKAKRFGQLLRYTPFVRCIILNGSVAAGRATEKSDIDFMIVSKEGRIFTARFLVVALAILTGSKRSKDENRSHSGRFCINQYITDNEITRLLRTNQLEGRLFHVDHSWNVLVWGDRKIFDRQCQLYAQWAKRYQKQSLRDNSLVSNVCAIKNEHSPYLKRAGEHLLSGRFGDWVERRLRQNQKNRIFSDPQAKKFSKNITVSDKELRFHPPKLIPRVDRGRVNRLVWGRWR